MIIAGLQIDAGRPLRSTDGVKRNDRDMHARRRRRASPAALALRIDARQADPDWGMAEGHVSGADLGAQPAADRPSLPSLHTGCRTQAADDAVSLSLQTASASPAPSIMIPAPRPRPCESPDELSHWPFSMLAGRDPRPAAPPPPPFPAPARLAARPSPGRRSNSRDGGLGSSARPAQFGSAGPERGRLGSGFQGKFEGAAASLGASITSESGWPSLSRPPPAAATRTTHRPQRRA